MPLEAIRHKDRRVNIPTEELKDFVPDEHRKPQTKQYPRGLYDRSTDGTVYKRDPALDPQLVWLGKDQQDSEPFNVPIVPVYIQEKVHPQAIIENVRREAAREARRQGETKDTKRIGNVQAKLFDDFNGIKFEEMIDFYRHDQHWSNRMILGDSLMVMASLAEKEGLKGQVQMIYIDPPYGIRFRSNWQVSTRDRSVDDAKVQTATRQPEQVKAFRDTWALGINSYLTYMRDRLIISRELLSDSGSIFVQISDENLHRVRALMDEVFGQDNYAGLIAFSATTGQTSGRLAQITDYLLWYAKDMSKIKFRKTYEEVPAIDNPTERYVCVETPQGDIIDLSVAQKTGQQPVPEGRVLKLDNPTSQTGNEASRRPFHAFGQEFRPSGTRGWSASYEDGLPRVLRAGYFHKQGNSIWFKAYRDKGRFRPRNALWADTRTNAFGDPKVYVVQTATTVLERCINMTTDPGDLVLDPTCGSGTTAYVAEQWGRRWITTDTSRVALALARTRLMSARFPFYQLMDSPEGKKLEAQLSGQPIPDGKSEYDVRKGFVCKRFPSISMSTVANCTELDAIHECYQPELESLRAALNKQCKTKWEEWEVPREADDKWSADAKKTHEKYWELRRKRQAEIDASIARKADVEYLYDQPYEDNKRIRVTGPFTVESLSPHRQVSPWAKAEESRAMQSDTTRRVRALGPDDFGHMIIDNLRKAGVQNTKKGERLEFETLEPHAGEWIHAKGSYKEKDGTEKSVAVCIGPEYGTVGSDLIKYAAMEAVKGVGFDVLVVCGFAFDPAVNEETRRYGKLTVLITRMNPDLAMGDELLKKTGAANLFMVFGEPDIAIEKQKDGKLVVEVKGVDVYDPTTGEIRSSSTDDIACWFIDTNYNEESFFVRHAYYCGADDKDGGPYDRLKRALRAEINEEAWASLYQTRSTPFDPPKPKEGSKGKGKVAVKVINHYGDEVMQVYEV
ncbi:MAG: site-specific DNA-methyltransferase [Planctomycetes bacterium]|nr:site-specific DNA-methyltransferase [Planctomycetota bacterium]MCW8135916.1 site-specific DNA-methyltransferase [Planctomycetota bacterium]